MQSTRYCRENLTFIIIFFCIYIDITPALLTSFKKVSPDSVFNSLENIGNIGNNESLKEKVLKTKDELLDTAAKIQEHEEHVEAARYQSDSENESVVSRDKERRPSESLAQRAKSISRTHLTKLRGNLSVEDLAKFVPGFHHSGYDSDNTSESAIRSDLTLGPL